MPCLLHLPLSTCKLLQWQIANDGIAAACSVPGARYNSNDLESGHLQSPLAPVNLGAESSAREIWIAGLGSSTRYLHYSSAVQSFFCRALTSLSIFGKWCLAPCRWRVIGLGSQGTMSVASEPSVGHLSSGERPHDVAKASSDSQQRSGIRKGF